MMNCLDGNNLELLRDEKDAENFIKCWCSNDLNLHEYLNSIIVERNIKISELMKNSCINRNYGYNLLNGKRRNPGRDKVLALCVAMKLTAKETQELLMVAKAGGLYFRSERDVRIATALNGKIGDVLRLNILLESKGLDPLDV